MGGRREESINDKSCAKKTTCAQKTTCTSEKSSGKAGGSKKKQQEAPRHLSRRLEDQRRKLSRVKSQPTVLPVAKVAAVAQAVEVDQEVVRIVINERGEVLREEKRIQKK